MAKIEISPDPTLYLRNSGLRAPAYNMLNASFTPGRNKEHRRPVHVSVLPASKEIK